LSNLGPSLTPMWGDLHAPLLQTNLLSEYYTRCSLRPVKAEVSVHAPEVCPSLSFRAFLQSEFARRCSANSQYSLRAYAMHLDIDHSTLSQLLRGKRPLTEKMIRKLGGRLRLGESELDDFVICEGVFTAASSSRMREVEQLVYDTLNLISNPDHLNILELVHLDEFKPDSRWIAQVLDITADEVNVALNRLTRLGLLEMSSRDRWTAKSGASASGLNDFVKTTIQQLSERVRELSRASASASPLALRQNNNRRSSGPNLT
jgi:uncharacterized protein (TIGR02147 family)